jgi:hypothetical protein
MHRWMWQYLAMYDFAGIVTCMQYKRLKKAAFKLE